MTATPQILLRHADAIADLSEPTAAEIAARKVECERLVNDRVESSVDAAPLSARYMESCLLEFEIAVIAKYAVPISDDGTISEVNKSQMREWIAMWLAAYLADHPIPAELAAARDGWAKACQDRDEYEEREKAALRESEILRQKLAAAIADLSKPPASVDEGWRLLALEEVTMSGDKLYRYPTGWEAVSEYGFVVNKHTVPICRRLNIPAELTRLREELDVAEQRCRRQEALVWGIHAALGGDDRECGDDVKALAIEVTAELKAAKAECERLQKKAVDTAYAEREAGAARANSMDAEIRRFIMERDELRQRIAALEAERDKIQSDYGDYVNGENVAITNRIKELEADRKLDSDALAAAEVTIATLEATAAEAIGLLARSRAHISNMLTVLKDEIDAFLASHPSASVADKPRTDQNFYLNPRSDCTCKAHQEARDAAGIPRLPTPFDSPASVAEPSTADAQADPVGMGAALIGLDEQITDTTTPHWIDVPECASHDWHEGVLNAFRLRVEKIEADVQKLKTKGK